MAVVVNICLNREYKAVFSTINYIRLAICDYGTIVSSVFIVDYHELCVFNVKEVDNAGSR